MIRPRRAPAGHSPPRRRSGRRGGDSGTRDAILAAARARFGRYGYDGATIRAIAADAGVDAALVHHFFGSKEHLFAAAMSLPVTPGDVLDAALAPGAREPGRSLGEHLLRTVLGAWDDQQVRATFLGLLRSAVTSDQAAAMLREFVTESILGRIAHVAHEAGRETGPEAGQETRPEAGQGAAPGAGGDADSDAAYRAALVASQVLGLALTRYVLQLDPVAQAGTDALAAALGPTLDRYLTGQIR